MCLWPRVQHDHLYFLHNSASTAAKLCTIRRSSHLGHTKHLVWLIVSKKEITAFAWTSPTPACQIWHQHKHSSIFLYLQNDLSNPIRFIITSFLSCRPARFCIVLATHTSSLAKNHVLHWFCRTYTKLSLQQFGPAPTLLLHLQRYQYTPNSFPEGIYITPVSSTFPDPSTQKSRLPTHHIASVLGQLQRFRHLSCTLHCSTPPITTNSWCTA